MFSPEENEECLRNFNGAIRKGSFAQPQENTLEDYPGVEGVASPFERSFNYREPSYGRSNFPRYGYFIPRNKKRQKSAFEKAFEALEKKRKRRRK